MEDYKRALRILKKADWEKVRQNGSHIQMRHISGKMLTVPAHKEFDKGTKHAIEKQSGITLW